MATKQKTSTLTKGTIVLFVVAMALLLIAGVGSARAALTYYSQDYTAQVTLPDIGVTLQENGQDVSFRNYAGANDQWNTGSNTNSAIGTLAENLTGTDGQVMPGKAYPEAISVKNSGNIDQYVRVKVQKYWMEPIGDASNPSNADYKKTTKLLPKMIGLNFLTGNGWVENPAERTMERSVYYYTKVLPVGQVTPDLTDTLTIDKAVLKKVDTQTVSQDGSYKTIVTTYVYNGFKFMVEAEVDAVQTHNAADAIKSAWSIDVNVSKSDGSISLK